MMKVKMEQQTRNIQICRLCGQVSEQALIDIYNGTITNLHEKINDYLPITITKDDTLPLTSCVVCTNTLLSFDQLVTTCTEANKYFEELHANTQQELTENLQETEASCSSQKDFNQFDENLPEIKQESFEMKCQPSNSQESQTFCIDEEIPPKNQTKQAIETAINQKTINLECKSTENNSNSNKFKETMFGETKIQLELLKTDEIKETINGKTYYKCKICGKSLQSLYTYKFHLQIHTGERSFVCDLCGKQFRNRQNLQRHLNDTHAEIKKFKCDICQRPFKTKQSALEHRNIHTNERPYICDLCGKAFKQKASLFVHNRLHSEQLPFKCGFCSRGYHTQHLLALHVTKHTGEKPHACDVCGKTFRIKYEMTRHRLVHSDVKPFKCTYCGLGFRMKRYLKRHLSSNHKNDVKYI